MNAIDPELIIAFCVSVSKLNVALQAPLVAAPASAGMAQAAPPDPPLVPPGPPPLTPAPAPPRPAVATVPPSPGPPPSSGARMPRLAQAEPTADNNRTAVKARIKIVFRG